MAFFRCQLIKKLSTDGLIIMINDPDCVTGRLGNLDFILRIRSCLFKKTFKIWLFSRHKKYVNFDAVEKSHTESIIRVL